MEQKDYARLIEEVPDYQGFLTVDELTQSAHRLAERFPEAVQRLPIGVSRQGDPIEALKIGRGSKTALLFAMPHPNEPIGSMMLEYLTSRLAEDPALCESLGYTWYIVKCIDPDGTRLNEGWFKGPFSITTYARHFYRPPSHQQVEWTFPIDYKTLHFDAPLPETCALMKLIEDIRPDFIFSLHNSGFGGVYLYLSRPSPSLYTPFYELVAGQELPLHLGEPEVPEAVELSKAIFTMLTLPQTYDFLEKNTGADPAPMLRQGSSSYEYALRFCNPFFLVCEMPYFYSPAIHDTSLSSIVRRQAILDNLARSRRQAEWEQALFTSVQPELSTPNPFKEAVQTHLEVTLPYLAAQETWARGEPKLDALATVAEAFDSGMGSRFYQLLQVGMFVRMLETQICSSGETPGLRGALAQAQQAFDTEAQALEAQIAYQAIPIRKLVRVQLGAALLAAEGAAQGVAR